MQIRDRIKELLDGKNWTVYKLSKESGVAQSTLSDILNGKNKNPNFDTLIKISDALGVYVDRLTGESASSIIENKLKEITMTMTELALKAQVPLTFLENLDNVVPDYEIDLGEQCYSYITSIAWVLGIPGSELRLAFARQEIPTYDGPVSNIVEDFASESFEEYVSNDITNRDLLYHFKKLNNLGKNEAVKRVEELTQIDKYVIMEIVKPHLLPNAAHEIEGATDEDKAHDDAIMDDDNF